METFSDDVGPSQDLVYDPHTAHDTSIISYLSRHRHGRCRLRNLKGAVRLVILVHDTQAIKAGAALSLWVRDAIKAVINVGSLRSLGETGSGE